QPTSLSAADFEEREDNRQRQQSLQEHMLEQINLLHFSKVDQLIAYCIVDSLDNKGFLDTDIAEITASVQQLLASMDYEEVVEEDEVSVVLKHIQRLDPVGVGARNLAECLLIQLEGVAVTTPCRQDAIKFCSIMSCSLVMNYRS